MKDLTDEQARAEAVRRWGAEGAIRVLRGPTARRGRLSRYRCVVGNGRLGPACSVQGHGDTWRDAFADAARAAGVTNTR